jgi:hypothetical protein
MKIRNEGERFKIMIMGTLAIRAGIEKDPSTIQRGYDKVMDISKLTDELIAGKNLHKSELVDIAEDLKNAVLDELPTIRDALKNLDTRNYDPGKVASALASCLTTLDYLRTKYE